jgi:hypothetical protein
VESSRQDVEKKTNENGRCGGSVRKKNEIGKKER